VAAKPVGSVLASVVNGRVSTTFKLPAAIPPGCYKIVATFPDSSDFFPAGGGPLRAQVTVDRKDERHPSRSSSDKLM